MFVQGNEILMRGDEKTNYYIMGVNFVVTK